MNTKRYVNLSDEERDFHKRTLSAKVRQEVKNFTRNGLCPRHLIHPLVSAGVPTTANTSDDVEFVSLSACWKKYEQIGDLAIVNHNLMNLQSNNIDNRTTDEKVYDEH